MKTVRLYYKRWVFPCSKKIQVPQTWKELTIDQFLTAAMLYQHKIDDLEFLHLFLGLSYKMIDRLDNFQLYKLSEMLSFISNIQRGLSFFFLPDIPGTRLVSPERNLGNMSFQQFMNADTYFSHYLVYNELNMLDRMIASLYMKRKERFVVTTKKEALVDLDKNAALIRSRLDDKTKFAIFFNFILVKEWLSNVYPYLFPKDQDSDLHEIKLNQHPKTVDWLELFDRFVGDQIPQMEKYQSMNVMDAFRILNRKIKDAKRK